MYLLFIGLSSLVFLPHGAFLKEFKNGAKVPITCKTNKEQGAFWFRLQDSSDFRFIAYLSKAKKIIELPEKFSVDTSQENTLTLENFEKAHDSGLYSCVSVNNNKLHFGPMIQVNGEPDPPASTLKPITAVAETTQTPSPTTLCEDTSHGSNKANNIIGEACELHILLPLAAGCGLLLILLVVTILYCNRIRTRRCPHHYKRQPRNRPAGHNVLPNQHVF